MECWYLLYCKPKQEQRAQDNLRSQGIESYLPRLSKRKTACSRVTLQPLFPRYLFVRLDPFSIQISAVRNTRGISDFVRCGIRLQMVPEALIVELKDRAKREQRCELNRGDTVLLTEGCFKDLHAIYQQSDGDSRSILLVKLLNQQAKIVVDNGIVARS
ncbi:transcription/translation regulatory transformer protein RfaH [Pseudoalteromonas sp. OOF1S-7]|uniref:transcription/translation regulatory transformer protein RfaH n=1 Tax=Pseudoalteromonas sp. OOF1S-7 TaxID=2917757 RepID=UPI001EF552A3|nr:transcription/translation regulatory transformer protein RfaH [Pseudoalteromonas sp. OOF1S-7]MCG7536357.1 transcription/translation regulatory transformer protein RfaH [Pseudoalteromonas sp. OOF1S-7]